MDPCQSSIPQEGDHSPDSSKRAAQYVRMSTENQRYSTLNQADAIRAYASAHRYNIVRTYADEGRSGLTIGKRDALQQLLADVATGQADFSTILVYDVSRWGRFQDTDESAYYEYQCRRAGVRVVYCAETFSNDGSITSDLMKMLKRTMAAEYSRELSVKTFSGQCRQIELGFRQGGSAGYALRRELVDADRLMKAQLAHAETKYLKSDHVILVPGPYDEVKIVRRIFKLFTSLRKNEGDIARLLNSEEVRTSTGRPWTLKSVRRILEGEKYAGHNIWNKTSQKLRGPYVRNPPSMWIRRSNAFEAIVEERRFEKANEIISERRRRFTKEDMLERLARLLQKKGYLSRYLIDAGTIPHSNTYRKKFGSLTEAYSQINYTPTKDLRFLESARRLRKCYPAIVSEIIERGKSEGVTVTFDRLSKVFTVNNEFTVRLALLPCREGPEGTRKWKMYFNAHPSDLTVLARMEPGDTSVLDYHVLPSHFVTMKKLTFGVRNGTALEAYRSDTLDRLYALFQRRPIQGMV